ncbi:unnamed protein product [Discula destructiva]
MSSFVLQSGYAELAKIVHSLSGSLTTCFLFTRLWARSTKHQGLWRDDYILIAAWVCLLVSNGLAAASPVYGFNVLNGTAHGVTIQFTSICFMDVAIALSKTAFATTLLRLTRGTLDMTILWATIVVVNSFGLAMVVANWLDICETRYAFPSLSGFCVSMTVIVWIHTGNAISCLLADVILAVYPWRVIRQVRYVSDKEKWSVAISMGLVGLSLLVGILKIVLLSLIPSHDHGKVDYTYGIIALGCTMQGEAAIVIIAQTIPVIRVLLWPYDSSNAGSVSKRPSSLRSPDTKAADKPGEGVLADVTESKTRSIALVQLASGKIVRSDSEEGTAFQAQQASTQDPIETSGEAPEALSTGAQDDQPIAVGAPTGLETADVDDEVHKIWQEMGLSRRAWSKSPSTSPTRPATVRD